MNTIDVVHKNIQPLFALFVHFYIRFLIDIPYKKVYNKLKEVIYMPISYNKLFDLMESKGIKKYDLRKAGISPTIVDRLVKDNDVNTSTISRLCQLLDCQPGDIMEYAEDEAE